jgi:hypothetical protein
MLALVYDDFRDDNEGTVRGVLSFLEVKDDVVLPVLEANPTVHVRSQRLHHLLRAISAPRGPAANTAKAAVKALTPRSLRRRALEATKHRVVYGEAPPADAALMAQLRERFEPEVAALSEYLDRDLTRLWGYDGIA